MECTNLFCFLHEGLILEHFFRKGSILILKFEAVQSPTVQYRLGIQKPRRFARKNQSIQQLSAFSTLGTRSSKTAPTRGHKIICMHITKPLWHRSCRRLYKPQLQGVCRIIPAQSAKSVRVFILEPLSTHDRKNIRTIKATSIGQFMETKPTQLRVLIMRRED